MQNAYKVWSALKTTAWPHKSVQYKVLHDKWFVVSGTFESNSGFYVKGVKRGSDVVQMQLMYPEDNSPFDDGTVSAMAKGFTGD